jgi:hypothetical protein
VLVTIVVSESVADAVDAALRARGGGNANAGMAAIIANVVGENARAVQDGIVRPQLSSATRESRMELLSTVRQAQVAATDAVLADGAISITVEP